MYKDILRRFLWKTLRGRFVRIVTQNHDTCDSTIVFYNPWSRSDSKIRSIFNIEALLNTETCVRTYNISAVNLVKIMQNMNKPLDAVQ